MPDGTPTDAASLRGLRTAGVVAALALVLLIVSLGSLVRFDDDVWRTVLTARGCAADRVVDRTVDVATRALLALVVGVTLVHARRHGLRSVWAWTAAAALGLFAGTTMKHLLTRDRPSSLPDVRLGYSFPSAHAMNSVIAVLAVLAFTRAVAGRRWLRSAAVLLTIAVIGGRLLLARHWVCDVTAGILAALALGGLVVPAVERWPRLAPSVVAAVLVAVYGADRWMAGSGFRLPAPLVSRALALVDVDLGSDANVALTGGWREAGDEAPGGSLVWLEGAGTIPVGVPSALLAAHAGAPAPFRLAFAGRPALPSAGCTTVTVGVNGRALAAFVPFNGWREYRVPIAPDVLRAGRNEVAIDVRAGTEPRRFAVAYVRLAGSGAE